jgi:hypothetical protein
LGVSQTNTQKLIISFASAAAAKALFLSPYFGLAPNIIPMLPFEAVPQRDLDRLKTTREALQSDAEHTPAIDAAAANNLNMLLRSLHALQ